MADTPDRRTDPPYRHARAMQDNDGEWHITTHYDLLPIEAFVTFEYNGDDYLPVVWDTLPASREEQEQVALQASETIFNAQVATPEYHSDGDGAVYLRGTDGADTLICVCGQWGNPYQIAHALNQTFPGGDARAWHQAQRERAEATMRGLQGMLMGQSLPDMGV